MQMIPPVRFPVELQAARSDVLEDYVQARIAQLFSVFNRRLSMHVPGLPQEAVNKSLAEAFSACPPPEYSVIPLEDRDLQLVFRHDCMALGCLDPQCALCQHNPNRRCVVNFDRKYLVSDLLKARCGASIRIELVDRNTGLPIEEDIPDLRLEMYILDGNLYDNKFLEGGKIIEGGTEPEEELEACALMLNKKKNTPLLVCGTGGVNDSHGKVIIPLPRGNKVVLPELHVSDSSEAILSGRKPPFRLLVRALLPPGRPKLQIRHAISEGFVVATRRTRTAGKVEIPSLEDHVSKLEHMGKETVRKLQDIAVAGQQVGIEIDVGELNCIQKVGDFKMLALRAEQDGHLRQRLQHVLKLSREKWEEARDHAMRAVKGDSFMRVWYADRRATEMGLLFACRLGSVELERPVALIQTRMEGVEAKMEATMIADLVPVQRELVHRMQPQAAHSWWLGGHPGWAIFPVDSEQFMQSGNLSMSDGSMGSMGGGGGMGSSMGAGPSQRQQPQQLQPKQQQLQGGRPLATSAGGWLAPNQMQNQMMPPPGLPMAPPSYLGGGAGGGGGGYPGSGGGAMGARQRQLNPFGDVALSGGGGGGGMPPQQQQQQQQMAGMGGAGPMSNASGGGMAKPPGSGRGTASSGGGALSKRPHEPMLEPSPSGSHEQHRREFMAPPPSGMGGPQHRVTAASVAAQAAATAAHVAAQEAANDPSSNPNPFLSIQHHPSPQLAPVMAHLHDGAAPSLDLNALTSVPMDPAMFAHQHDGSAAHHMHQHFVSQQQHQAARAAGTSQRAYTEGAVPGGGQQPNKHLPSFGLGAMTSVEFDKVLMENMDGGSLNLGNSLQLPHTFLQGVLSSIPHPGLTGMSGPGGLVANLDPSGDLGAGMAAASAAAGAGGGTSTGAGAESPSRPNAADTGPSAGGPLRSNDSALDTMQSIEQALPDLSGGQGSGGEGRG